MQDIWNRVGEASKTGHGKKGLISTFACFLTATAKFNFWKEDWALGYVSTQI